MLSSESANWHGEQATILQPALLENAALPIELSPYEKARARIGVECEALGALTALAVARHFITNV